MAKKPQRYYVLQRLHLADKAFITNDGSPVMIENLGGVVGFLLVYKRKSDLIKNHGKNEPYFIANVTIREVK